MKLTKLTNLLEGKNPDVERLLDRWYDQNRAYSFEGDKGVKNLTRLVKVLDPSYRTLDDFLMDNSGALEAIIEWIKERASNEWLDNLWANVGPEEDDE